MLNRTLFLPALVMSGLAGCAWTPGNYLDTSSLDTPKVEATTQKYQVTRITPDVIVKQNDAERQAADSAGRQLGIAEGDPATFRYHVAPQDILGIVVWNHPELSLAGGDALSSTLGVPNSAAAGGGNSLAMPYAQSTGGTSLSDPLGYTVGPDGRVFFPFAGNVQVAGDSLEQIREKLTAALGQYIRNPQVSVRVLSYRSQQVELTGELKAPGELSITDRPLTLSEAIARAGGTTADADLQRVRLTRDGKLTVVDAFALLDKGDVRQNIMLKAGDIVNVPDRLDSRIFVMGEVMKPTTLYLNRGHLTLADAITGASGIDNLAANVRQIYVVRGAKDDPTAPNIYQLDMSQPNALLLASAFQLQRMDVVYVGTAAGATFNRVLNLITPTLQTLFYTRELTR